MALGKEKVLTVGMERLQEESTMPGNFLDYIRKLPNLSVPSLCHLSIGNNTCSPLSVCRLKLDNACEQLAHRLAPKNPQQNCPFL